MTAAHSVDIPPDERPWMHGAAGVLGGSIAMSLFYPLDFLRTRMHTLHQGSRPMQLRSAREIVQQEGLRGMYKGIGVSVVSHSVGWGLYLLTFRSAERCFEDYFGISDSGAIATSGQVFLSACIAATFTGTIITPLHLIKTRRQLYDKNHLCGSGTAAVQLQPLPRGLAGIRSIIKHEGFPALFRGVGPQILLTGNTTIQVTLYEWFRRNCFTNHDDPSPIQVATASAFSKAVACVLFNPLEVVRTRLQDQRNLGNVAYKSMWSGLETIWRREGFGGVYRGLPVNIARVVPSTVVAFVLYEKCLCVIRQAHQRLTARTFVGKSATERAVAEPHFH